jgi:hypothetical protein
MTLKGCRKNRIHSRLASIQAAGKDESEKGRGVRSGVAESSSRFVDVFAMRCRVVGWLLDCKEVGVYQKELFPDWARAICSRKPWRPRLRSPATAISDFCILSEIALMDSPSRYFIRMASCWVEGNCSMHAASNAADSLRIIR